MLIITGGLISSVILETALSNDPGPFDNTPNTMICNTKDTNTTLLKDNFGELKALVVCDRKGKCQSYLLKKSYSPMDDEYNTGY